MFGFTIGSERMELRRGTVDFGNYWSVLALLLAVAGCTMDSVVPSAVAPPPGQASLNITRSSSLIYAAALASVDVNGARVADLGVGQSYMGVVRSGPAVLTVSAWSSPGSSSFRFTVEPGNSYRFVVTPRIENTMVGVLPAAFAGPLAGMAAKAAEGGGPFQITP